MSANPWAHPIPALAIDARFAAIHHRPNTLNSYQVRERQAVAFILDTLAEAGFRPMGDVLDGLGGEPCGDSQGSTLGAMEAIFDLDDACVPMADAKGARVGSLLFIRGNRPEEILADWSSMRGDQSGFSAAVDAATRPLWDTEA
jgi:hypothetical protein